MLAPRAKAGQNIWDYVGSVLDGRREADEKDYRHALKGAADRWTALPASRRALLALMTRFELTPEQAHRVANPDARARAGIIASDEEIVANPYLLCEQDQGSANSETIALETIDHGMLPSGEAARFFGADDTLAQDDARRVRAVSVEVLSDAGQAGDTLLSFRDTMTKITDRFPDRRACRPDRDVVIANADYMREALAFDPDGDPPTVALERSLGSGTTRQKGS